MTDGSLGQPFAAYLRGLRHFTVLEADKPSVLAQTKRNLQGDLRLGHCYILYTESDEQLFFEHGLGKFLARVPGQIRVGVGVASRSATSFATYPAAQDRKSVV